MKKTLLAGLLGLTASVAMIAGGILSSGQSGTAWAQQGLSADERTEVEAIVRDYLLKNPEILVEMQQALETRQQAEQKAQQVATITESSDEIFNAAYDGIYGNPDGKVTMVEFFDYNCGYCKRAMTDMEAMVAADPELRVVLKEFPILGPDSQKAHIVSMAFHKLMPEKYGEFHVALLGGAGRADEAAAIKAAVAAGADEAALREAMKDPAITEAFAKTYELANKLSITGTPSYVIGEEVVFGALGQEVLSEKVAATRE